MNSGYREHIGGREVRYLTPDDDITGEGPEPVGYDILDDLELRRQPRLRRVLFSLIRPEPLYFGLLHWSDGTDLEGVDRLVRAGATDKTTLATALLVEPRSITCENCDAVLRVAVPDAGNPLVTTELLRRHSFVRDCPVCHRPFGLLVAELLDDSSSWSSE